MTIIRYLLIICFLIQTNNSFSLNLVTDKQIEQEERIDSIRLDKILKNALDLVKHNIHSDNFLKEYDFYPDDSSYVAGIFLNIGFLFSKENKHVLVRRTTPRGTFINLYVIKENKLKSVLYHEQCCMSYVDDTIMDINGDGFKDFLVHFYPASGCCRRDVYKAYLNQSKDITFTKSYVFINPTFFSNEKIIRGIEYGHPGEVGLYKFKWEGFKIDTIEYIYPDVNDKGYFIKTLKSIFRPTINDGIKISSVPKEYLNIKSYEWFINY